MYTNYFKNFSRNELCDLRNNMKAVANKTKPLWYGTIYIGTEPLYLECHVKWLAEKINLYFVNVKESYCDPKAKKLYILRAGVKDFFTQPDCFTTNVYFTQNHLCTKPDLIVHNNCVYLHYDDEYYMSVTSEDYTNFYHLGENHLLMRVLNYIFDSSDNIMLHGAVVGYKDYGILITGLSGYGKSTLSAHCLAQGMDFIGDDRVMLSKSNQNVFASPIYTTLSLSAPVPGIQPVKTISCPNSTKDIVILDRKKIAQKIKIRAVLEPHNIKSDKPEIKPTKKSPVITKICADYCNFSLLTRTINPLHDYKKISNLLENIDFFIINLSNNISDNANAIFNLAKEKSNEI